MANLRNELKSRHGSLRRLYDDLKGSSFARLGWDAQVRARRTLGSDETIEHWFLAEHFLIAWSNWRGLLDRYGRYFGLADDSFPRTWVRTAIFCDQLVWQLGPQNELDELLAKSWFDADLTTDRPARRRVDDVASICLQIARGLERAELVRNAERAGRLVRAKVDVSKELAPDRDVFALARSVVFEQNGRMVERWHELPSRVQEQARGHLRHYLHSTLGVSWLVDAGPAVSGLLSVSWGEQPLSISFQAPPGPPGLDAPISGPVGKVIDRLKAAIAELGYEAVVEDLSSPELIGGEDSLLASEDVMVVPGHLADTSRPILLAVTTGWGGKEPRSFARVMRQVKARLIEANGAIKMVIVFCDCWDSTSFAEEHREELRAHDQNGTRFLFVLVGVPDRILVPVPVELG